MLFFLDVILIICRYGVPRIAFLNKMDREGVSVPETIDIQLLINVYSNLDC